MLNHPGAVRAGAVRLEQGALAGLDDAERETLGLGIVRSIDFAKQLLVVETTVPESAIAAVRIGRQKFRPA